MNRSGKQPQARTGDPTLEAAIGEAFEAAPDACYIHDADGLILKANGAAATQTGIEADALTGMSLFEIAVDVDRDRARERWQRLLTRPGEAMSIQSRHQARTGQVFPVDIRVTALRAGDEWLLSLVRDASGERASQAALQHRVDFEHLLLKVSTGLIQSPMPRLDREITGALGLMGEFFCIDRAYLFLFSDAGETMSNTHEWVAPGIDAHAEELQNIPIETFPVLMEDLKADRAFHVPRVRDLPESSTERREFERENIQSILVVPVHRRRRLAGFVGFDAVNAERHWTDDSILGLRHIAQAIISVLESRQLSARLSRMAFHDPLTGLANRKLLNEQFKRVSAVDDSRELAMLMMDLDDFKQVNDRLGHGAGDALLCEVAERLKALAPEPNLVARLGGDEFVILMPDADRDQARELARQVLESVQKPIRIEKQSIRASSSIGIVVSRSGDPMTEHLLRHADVAMYAAKAEGKNCYREYQPDLMVEGRGRGV